MIYEPAQPMADGPIEQYLDQARERLMLRHDGETVDVLLAEFHAHLVESASEVAAMGFGQFDAERRAIELFGGGGIGNVAGKMAAQHCAGDRTWGRVALCWGVLMVVALCFASAHGSVFRGVSVELMRSAFLGSLLVYGYACLRAKRYAMGRALAVTGSLTLLAFALLAERGLRPTSAFQSKASAVVLGDPIDTSWPAIQIGKPILVASSEGSERGLLDAIRKSVIEEASRKREHDGPVSGSGSPGSPDAASPNSLGWSVGLACHGPMPGLAQVDTILPHSVSLAAVWLEFALITRALALWLTRFSGTRDAGGVFLA